MNTNQDSDSKQPAKRNRSAPRYWVEIKGKLYARLQYRADNGKYQVKYKPIADKRKARSAVEEMRRELETHGEETLHSDKMTFTALAAEFQKIRLVDAVYSNGVKVAGKRSLKPSQTFVKALVEHFGHKAVRQIKASDLETYKNKRINTPVEIVVNVRVEQKDESGKIKVSYRKEKKSRSRKIASVNRELAQLRTMLNFAVQNGWLIQNPFEKAKGIVSTSAEVERDRVLSFDEEVRLLAACTGKREHLKALLICALDTAMRHGEILKMRWQDVNFTTGEIYIPQTNTKTEDARTVGITPRLRTELEQLWETSPKENEFLVFGITNTIKTAFKSACKEAAIKDFRFHDCRHTATTRMIASGSPHTEVMKITGHTQLKTFLRYLNITPETASIVASRLNVYLVDKQMRINEVSSAIN
jgi:integrase